jgi:hypothetical protein
MTRRAPMILQIPHLELTELYHTPTPVSRKVVAFALKRDASTRNLLSAPKSHSTNSISIHTQSNHNLDISRSRNLQSTPEIH